jgi:hypothetical protein
VLQFYDYLFYRSFIRAQRRTSAPHLYGIYIVTLVQGLTLLAAVVFPCSIIAPDPFQKGKIVFGAFAVILFAFNLYRYRSGHGYEEMRLQWDGNSPAERRQGTKRIAYYSIVLALILIAESVLKFTVFAV